MYNAFFAFGVNMCGVIGMKQAGAGEASLKALLTLQHRGQDGAGVYLLNTTTGEDLLSKETGLAWNLSAVSEVRNFSADLSIAHTRYSTIGTSRKEDLQPFCFSDLSLCHNGNVTNMRPLMEWATQRGLHLTTKNDIELIQMVFSQGAQDCLSSSLEEKIFAGVEKVYSMVEGSYSVVGIYAKKYLFAFRDPYAFRPLVFGRSGNAFCFASESQVLDRQGFHFVKDVEPGEAILISPENEVVGRKFAVKNKKTCMFEWVYFAGAETTIEGRPVYQSRVGLGKSLGQQIQLQMSLGKIKPDFITPVPETSRISAISLAEFLQIPYREVLVKNRYINRSFILNTQEERERAVEIKLNPVPSEIQGKNILLVDDSIVRGTTSKRIVEVLRKFGAGEIYMASTCPPIRHPCYYGIDFPLGKDLVAYERTTAEIAKVLGVDALIYTQEKDLKAAIGTKDLCDACVSGKYPCAVKTQDFSHEKITEGNI